MYDVNLLPARWFTPPCIHTILFCFHSNLVLPGEIYLRLLDCLLVRRSANNISNNMGADLRWETEETQETQEMEERRERGEAQDTLSTCITTVQSVEKKQKRRRRCNTT